MTEATLSPQTSSARDEVVALLSNNSIGTSSNPSVSQTLQSKPSTLTSSTPASTTSSGSGTSIQTTSQGQPPLSTGVGVDNNRDIGTGEIVGIVVGIVAVIVAMIGVVYTRKQWTASVRAMAPKESGNPAQAEMEGPTANPPPTTGSPRSIGIEPLVTDPPNQNGGHW